MNETTEAGKVAELVERGAKQPITVQVVHEDQVASVLLVPNGGGYDRVSVKSLLAEYRKAPERREGTARFNDIESFMKHVNRFKDSDSLVFMDRSMPIRFSPIVILLGGGRCRP
jgi:hypothetical protein